MGFSTHGTLKATTAHFVEVSEAGRTHRELELRLHVRAHNALLDLVNDERICREHVGATYLYVSADVERAKAQIEDRVRILGAQVPTHVRLPDTLVVEVLLETIHGVKNNRPRPRTSPGVSCPEASK